MQSFSGHALAREKRSGAKLSFAHKGSLRQRCEAALGPGVFLTVRENGLHTSGGQRRILMSGTQDPKPERNFTYFYFSH